MRTLLLTMLLGCAVHTKHSGLVVQDRGRLELMEDDGSRLRLRTDETGKALYALSGCGVTVDGWRLGRQVGVRSWRVTDGGDGSEPFVGRLRRNGIGWAIADRNTGATMLLDPRTMGGLEAHEGELVMVVGFVTGPHLVNVVLWRALEGADGGTSR